MYFTGEYEKGATGFMRDVLTADWQFIDVGANVGKYMVIAAPRVREVICVEPNPIALWFLESNIVLNGFQNVRVVPIAVGEDAGEATLSQVGNDIGGASLIRNHSEGLEYKVPVRRGDSLAAPNSLTYLKIDVEGYEEFALRGFDNLLMQKRTVVQVEVTDQWLRSAGGSAEAMFSSMNALGYTPFLIGTRSFIRTKYTLVPLRGPLQEFQYDVIFLPVPTVSEFRAMCGTYGSASRAVSGQVAGAADTAAPSESLEKCWT